MAILRLLLLSTLFGLLLAACGQSSEPPPVAEPGQPTLVFIYTDN